MNADVRCKLEMAERALDFSRANPFSDPTSTTVVTRLGELVTRANALADQDSLGRVAEHAATVRRGDLRRAMMSHFLRPVVRAGELAARERPELVGKFRLPIGNANAKGFLLTARNIASGAIAERPLFNKVGISDEVLEDLSRVVAEFEQATEAAHSGRSKHVGANADLKVVTTDIMDLIGVLDGLNRHRYRADPEKLAAWESERTILSSSKGRSAATPVVPAQEGTGPDATKAA